MFGRSDHYRPQTYSDGAERPPSGASDIEKTMRRATRLADGLLPTELNVAEPRSASINYTSQEAVREAINVALAKSRETTANLAQGTTALGQQKEPLTSQKPPEKSSTDSQLVQDAQRYINANNPRVEGVDTLSRASSALPYPQQEHIENYKPGDPKLIADVEDHLKFQRQNAAESTSSPDGLWRIPETKEGGANFASLFPEVPQLPREPILATREDSPILENFPKNKATPLPQRLWGAFKKAMATAAIAGTLLLSQDSGPVAKKADVTPSQPENPPVLIQEPTIHDIPPLILHQAGIAPAETPQRPVDEPSTITAPTPVNISLEKAPVPLVPPPISEGPILTPSVLPATTETSVIPSAPPKTGGGFAAQETPNNMAKKPSFWQRLFGGK